MSITAFQLVSVLLSRSVTFPEYMLLIKDLNVWNHTCRFWQNCHSQLEKKLFFLAVGYKDGSTSQPMENTAGDAWGNRFSQRDPDRDGFAIDQGVHGVVTASQGCVSEMLLEWMLHKSHTNHHGITPFQILPGLLIPRVHKLSIKPAESTVKTTACFCHYLTGNGLTCRGV